MEKGFYKNFFYLYIVFVLQNMVILAIDLSDNMMLGAYSETAMSAVSAVNQLQFIFQQVIFALCECLIIFAGQYWGRKNIGKIKKIFSVTMLLSLGFAAILFVIVSIFPYEMLKIFTEDDAIIKSGVEYLSITRFTYIFLAVSLVFLAALKSVEIVRIGFFVSVITFFTNILLNYFLIFGNCGMPKLEVRGAAIATLVSRAIEMSAIVIFALFYDKRLNIKITELFSIDIEILKAYSVKALQMVLLAVLWGVSTAFQTVIMGHLSSNAIAANSSAAALFLLIKGAAKGAASAGGIIIAKYIGRGNLKEVRHISVKLQRLYLVLAVFGGVLLFIIRIPVLRLYDMTAYTEELANAFLIVLSVIYIGMAYQMPVSEGIIKGAGEITFVIKMNIVSSYLIVLPLAYIFAFVIKLNPIFVIIALNSDQIFKCIPVFIKVNYGRWIHRLTL